MENYQNSSNLIKFINMLYAVSWIVSFLKTVKKTAVTNSFQKENFLKGNVITFTDENAEDEIMGVLNNISDEVSVEDFINVNKNLRTEGNRDNIPKFITTGEHVH